MKAKDIMTTGTATCSGDDSIQKVAEIMRDNDCGAVPVVDGGKLAGIITDRDIVIRALAAGKNPLDLKVSSCMTDKVASISEDADLGQITSLMEQKQIRRVVVTGASDKIVGIVAQADVALHAPAGETGDVVKQVSK